MKKVMSVIISVLLLICCTFNIFAANNRILLPNEISDFVLNAFSDYTIKEKIPLYDVDNNVTAHIVTLNPIGYIIFSDTEIIECSHTTNYPIVDGQNYYFGLCKSFQKQTLHTI